MIRNGASPTLKTRALHCFTIFFRSPISSNGVVPRAIFSFASSASERMDTHPRTRRREHRLALRRLYAALRSPPEIPSLAYEATYTALLDHLRKKKEESMQEIYNILIITLGVLPLPDCPFTYESEDKDEKARSWPGAPQQFYKQFSSEKGVPSLGVSLIGDPRNEYNRLYSRKTRKCVEWGVGGISRTRIRQLGGGRMPWSPYVRCPPSMP